MSRGPGVAEGNISASRSLTRETPGYASGQDALLKRLELCYEQAEEAYEEEELQREEEERKQQEEEQQRKRQRVEETQLQENAEAASEAPGSGEQISCLEGELEKVRAEKQRASETEDFDAAHAAKERESQLLSQLQKLREAAAPVDVAPPSTGPAGAADDAELQALESELEKARSDKAAAIRAEDYDSADKAKSREKELLAKLEELKASQGGGDSNADTRRGELEKEISAARAAKQAAVEAEDYDAAHAAKARESAALTELESLGPAASANGATEEERKKLEAELAELREKKAAAVQAEDYDGAIALREQERALVAKLASLQPGVGAPVADAAERECKAAAVQEELARVRKEKQAAVLAEDYDAAHVASQKERQLLEQLGGSA